ncbi:MAG: preprotein translocase subunit SecY [Alphaproteobacteria bacterium]|jgi:preprotein translocase subunit SecY|nr:preprotein translocase subunit SecY [Alphaproteobacteria bacterium]
MAKKPNSSSSEGLWSKASTLRNRILFTLGVLVICRLGSYIPVPGVNPLIIKDFLSGNSQGLLGMFDLFSGGSLGRMTIFALNIIPYITAAIMMQLFVVISPTLAELKKDGENGRRQINQYTRYLTLVVCFVQAMSMAFGLETLQSGSLRAVDDPGWMFRFMTAITLTSGTFFVLWMGEKITERGIGNGVSLIIFAGIVSNLPFAMATVFTLGEKGALSVIAIIGIIVMIVVIIYGVVFVETAQRRVLVKYPKRQMGNNKISAGDTSYLPLKINNAGVIPPIFASSLLLVPSTLLGFFNHSGSPFLSELAIFFSRGGVLYLAFYALLIILFAFFYVSVVFNPKETSDNLKNSGGVILGIRPGQDTTNYLTFILNRLTVIGAAYLVLVCLLPEFLISKMSIPFYFGGTSLLIVVSVTIDTITQVQSHLMSYQYQSVLKKSKIMGR